MGSWKKDITLSIIREEVEAVDALLQCAPEGMLQDFITIQRPMDCTCPGPLLESPISLTDITPENFGVMVENGHCVCLINNTEQQRPACQLGVNLLHLACMYGPASLITRLLKEGFEPNTLSLYEQHTPMHFVTNSLLPIEKLLEFADLLLEAGADVNKCDRGGALPLHLAIENDYTLLAEMLVSKTALDIRNRSGETPLLLAVKSLHEDLVIKLVDAGADVNARDRYDMLAISVAIHRDNSRLLNAIVESPSFDVSVIGVPRMGLRVMNPLVYATCRENEEAVRILLQKGAYVDTVDDGDSHPLLIAAYTDNVNIGKLLISHGADVNLAPSRGYASLHHAAWEGNTEMCHLLLEAGANHDIPTSDKNTPLALACHGDFIEAIRFLLTRDCDVNNQDKDLDTPIHYCTFNGCHEGVKLLIEKGAIPDIENSYQVTPLWNSCFTGDLNSLGFLIQCNVRLWVPSRGIDQRAQSDDPTLIYTLPKSPLFVACDRHFNKAVKMLIKAGTELINEQWFWSGDHPEALGNDHELFDWLTQQATNPHSLLDLCRNAVRKQIGLHPQKAIERLEIPVELKHYLSMKSLVKGLIGSFMHL